MDLEITFTCICKDELWGFSDLIEDRTLEEARQEIIDLLHEDISAALEDYIISIKEIQ